VSCGLTVVDNEATSLRLPECALSLHIIKLQVTGAVASSQNVGLKAKILALDSVSRPKYWSGSGSGLWKVLFWYRFWP